jgi:hypothetical protein
MYGINLVPWLYKAMLLFFIAIFTVNLFDRKARLSGVIMNGFILIPFVLRLFSVR